MSSKYMRKIMESIKPINEGAWGYAPTENDTGGDFKWALQEKLNIEDNDELLAHEAAKIENLDLITSIITEIDEARVLTDLYIDYDASPVVEIRTFLLGFYKNIRSTQWYSSWKDFPEDDNENVEPLDRYLRVEMKFLKSGK